MIGDTFRILKTDLDIRPVYYEGNVSVKTHLHLVILAYWLVSIAQYKLNKKRICHEWSESVRVMERQVAVTARATRNDGARVEMGQRTDPEKKLHEISNVLKIKDPPMKRKNLCGTQSHLLKKTVTLSQLLNLIFPTIWVKYEPLSHFIKIAITHCVVRKYVTESNMQIFSHNILDIYVSLSA